EEPAPREERFVALLAARDEVLAAGATPPPPGEADTPPELRARLQRGQACLALLQQLRPRPGGGAGWPGREAAAAARTPPAPGPADPPGADTPARIGRFEVRRELGRGGCGVVFLAYDPRLGREVALKVPGVDALVTPELRERFHREARAAAGLDHPNVVPVYE